MKKLYNAIANTLARNTHLAEKNENVCYSCNENCKNCPVTSAIHDMKADNYISLEEIIARG